MRDAKPLEQGVITALRLIQIDRRLSWRALALAIGMNRDTFRRAMHGRPIWTVDVARIGNWLAEQQRAAERTAAEAARVDQGQESEARR